MAKTATKAKQKAAAKPKAKAKATAKPAAKKAPAKAAAATPTKKAEAEKPQWTPPSGPGTFCWQELFTTDKAGAAAFYGALFGWKCPDMPMGDSGATQGMIERGPDGIGCLSPVASGGTPSQWLSYVQVEDVDASASKIVSLGGHLTTLPVDIPGGHGRYAIAKDPQGAKFAIYGMPKGGC